MRTLLAVATIALLSGCADFVDEDGNTSIRQVAEGLQSLGDRLGELGEAIERDADIAAVPWEELASAVPSEIGGHERLDDGGDHATDNNGAGLSIAHGRYLVNGDSMYVGIADFGALRSGVTLALRWVAPMIAQGEIDGDVEEVELEGRKVIRISDDDGDLLIATIVEDRFGVIAGGEGPRSSDFVRDALRAVDYDQLRQWASYGTK